MPARTVPKPAFLLGKPGIFSRTMQLSADVRPVLSVARLGTTTAKGERCRSAKKLPWGPKEVSGTLR